MPLTRILLILLTAAACMISPKNLHADNAWETLPVFHNGRIMPLHTFARKIVRDVCGTEQPHIARDPIALNTLERTGNANIAERIRQLVPSNGRSFQASELLFSWLSEPEIWEYISLFPVADADYAREMFGPTLPGKSWPSPHRVSLYQLENSQRYQQRLSDIYRRHEQGQTARDFARYDHITERLAGQSQAFLELTFHPDRHRPTRMLSLLYQIVGMTGDSSSYIPAFDTWEYFIAWGEVANPRTAHPTTLRWNEIAGQLLILLQSYEQSDAVLNPSPSAAVIERHYETLIALIDANLAEAAVLMESMYPGVSFRSESDDVSAISVEQLLPRLMSAANQPHQQAIRRAATIYYYSVKKFRKEIEAAYLALYDNGRSFRFLPIASPLVLEKGITENTLGVQPWATAAMILGSEEAFANRFFNQAGKPCVLAPIRSSWSAMQEQTAAEAQFQQAVRDAAMQIEARRATFVDADNQLLAEHFAKTGYPEADSLKILAEYRYDQLHPFYWMWVFALLSVVFCVIAGSQSASRPSQSPYRKTGTSRTASNNLERWFFIGSVLMLMLSMLIAFIGGVMRAAISGWAPVTNMYETVVMTAFAVAMIGTYFALYPLLHPAVRLAWQYTKFFQDPTLPFRRKMESSRTARNSIWISVCAGMTVYGSLAKALRLALMLLTFFLIALFAAGSDYVAEYGFWAAAMSMFETSDYIDLLTVIASVGLLVWFTPHILLALCLVPFILLRPSLIAREQNISGADWLKQAFRATLDRKLFLAITASIVLTVGLVAWLNRAEFNPDIRPIAAVLRSNFWLAVHVIAILISYAAAFIAWGLAVVALGSIIFSRYRRVDGQNTQTLLPEICQRVSPIIEILLKVALLLLIVGTVLGARWADYSWGRFWSWDPKEVWALITILFLAIVLHGKIARFYGPIGIITGALLASIAVIITWYGINFVFSGGRHTYGGGTASNATLFMWTFIGVNVAWGALALVRYALMRSAITKTGT